MDLFEELLGCVGFALVPPLAAGILQVMRGSRRAGMERRRQRENEPGCAACASLELDWAPDEVYVCTDCGYQGGDGLVARERRQRDESLRALPAAERESRAEEALAVARLRFEIAEQELTAFRVRLKKPGNSTVQAELLEGGELVRGLGWVHEGFAQLEIAAVCRGRTAPSSGLDALEPEMWLTQLGELDVECVQRDIDLALRAVRIGQQAI